MKKIIIYVFIVAIIIALIISINISTSKAIDRCVANGGSRTICENGLR